MCDLLNIKEKVINSLTKLFEDDKILFERNDGKGLAERCIVFRLAMYLQDEFHDYYVDCDFNNSMFGVNQQAGKPLINPDGSLTKRFVDIIIHKRLEAGSGLENDYICFEVKKWSNKTQDSVNKDRNNLRALTTQYGYKYGFHLVLGKVIDETTIEIFYRTNSSETFTWGEFCE